MSQMTAGGHIPGLTLGWRLRMALEHEGVSRQQIAAECGVDEATITRWTHDRTAPSRAALIVWALKTGVDLDWLERGTGESPFRPEGEPAPDDDPGSLNSRERARRAREKIRHADTRQLSARAA